MTAGLVVKFFNPNRLTRTIQELLLLSRETNPSRYDTEEK
jgi:hypothetical protein